MNFKSNPIRRRRRLSRLSRDVSMRTRGSARDKVSSRLVSSRSTRSIASVERGVECGLARGRRSGSSSSRWVSFFVRAHMGFHRRHPMIATEAPRRRSTTRATVAAREAVEERETRRIARRVFAFATTWRRPRARARRRARRSVSSDGGVRDARARARRRRRERARTARETMMIEAVRSISKPR